MNKNKRIFNFASLTLLMVVFLNFSGIALAGQAPTGTYTASTGQSAGTASGGRVGGGRGRFAGKGGSASESASGANVTMNINSYSTKDELDKLRAAQNDPSNFINTLRSFNHGSITVGGQTFTVNAATSIQTGSQYHIYLLTSSPLIESKTGPRGGRQATGASGGYIELTVNSSGAGDGRLYTSTQVVINTNGEITARGGASTATQLSNVARQ